MINKKTFCTFLLFWNFVATQVMAQFDNVQFQVPHIIKQGFTSSNPSSYTWLKKVDTKQHIGFCIQKTEVRNLFLQEGNCAISFNLFNAGFYFSEIELSFDNAPNREIYELY